MMKLNVLVVEDEQDLANGIMDYLQLENIDSDYAANGQVGLNLASQNPFDVILLDINLPLMNGLQVCEALRAEGVDIPVLMLTARDTVDDKLAGFQAGTDDYLVKPFDMQEMVARVRSLAKRRSAQAKKLKLADLEVDLLAKTAKRQGQQLELTPTGWKLLEVLMRASPDVVSKEVLEQSVWGEDLPDTNALKVHLFRLRNKVDKPFVVPLIHTIPNHGVVMEVKDEN